MNHWLYEELTWQVVADRQREVESYRLQVESGALATGMSFANRIALKLGGWLIASGEKLQHRHQGTASVSTWVDKRNFAR